jgi:hypothetical protein
MNLQQKYIKVIVFNLKPNLQGGQKIQVIQEKQRKFIDWTEAFALEKKELLQKEKEYKERNIQQDLNIKEEEERYRKAKINELIQKEEEERDRKNNSKPEFGSANWEHQQFQEERAQKIAKQLHISEERARSYL